MKIIMSHIKCMCSVEGTIRPIYSTMYTCIIYSIMYEKYCIQIRLEKVMRFFTDAIQ